MTPRKITVRASDADWRRIAAAAIQAGVPIERHAGRLLAAAAALGAPHDPGRGPYPETHRRTAVFATEQDCADVQAWRRAHDLTWPEVLRVAADITRPD